MNKHAVVISRDWHSPAVRVDVTDTDIQVSMSLAEFIESLAAQVGNPALLFTEAGLRDKLRAAADEIILSMKRETARVM